MRRIRGALLLAFISCAWAYSRRSNVPSTPQTNAPPVEKARVVRAFPHDPGAFTQGLIFRDGVLEESTGAYGSSSLRRVELESGRVIAKIDLANEFFGEGLALLHSELFQLTWREHKCLVYDAQTLARRRELPYDGDGWGLTTDGTSLIMSDGSATLTYRDPQTFAVGRAVQVSDRGDPVAQLNELEWVRGEILANIWGTNRIARIEPASGHVLGYLDLAALPEPRRGIDRDNVANGIAFDAATGRLFVTGKRWSTMFEISAPNH